MRKLKFLNFEDIQLLLIYYRDVAMFNIPFSVVIGFLGMFNGFLNAFSFSFLTGGFLLSIYFYNLRKKEEYYFYYNKGMTNLHLWLGCIAINGMLVFLLNVFANLFR